MEIILRKPSSVGGRQSAIGSRQLAATTTTAGRTQHTARTTSIQNVCKRTTVN
jgi:hypothetical protein